MKRREFVIGLGAAASWPVVAHAQQPIPVIAFLNSGAADASASKALMSLTEASLLENGLLKGRDYVFDVRWANSDSSRFPALAAELLAGHPGAVVVTVFAGNPPAYPTDPMRKWDVQSGFAPGDDRIALTASFSKFDSPPAPVPANTMPLTPLACSAWTTVTLGSMYE